MRKSLLLLILMLAVRIASAESVSVSYQIYPEILLPGDYADVTLTLKASNDVKVNSITVTGASVEPSAIFSVGTIPAGGSYSITFSVKAEKVGRTNLEVRISTQNETITQNILIFVDDNFPSLTIISPVYKKVVNVLTFHVSSPVELRDVRVEALFDAVPKTVYLGNLGSKEGSMKFIPESENLRFKISFYNGRNYHEVVREVKIKLLEPKEVVVNVTSPYKSLYIGDAVTIPVEITNLRSDTIYSIKVSGSSQLGNFSDSISIAKLESGAGRTLNFKFSPSKAGSGEILFRVEFSDEFGNAEFIEKSFPIEVLESYAVAISNINILREGLKASVSADVSNNGRSRVYNAYAVAECQNYRTDYFIGNIDPSDFQSFELPLECNGSVRITVQWSNEIGENFRISQTVEFGERVVEVKENPFVTYISIAVALIVFGIIGFVIYRQIRK